MFCGKLKSLLETTVLLTSLVLNCLSIAISRRNLHHRFSRSLSAEFLIGLMARGTPFAEEKEVAMNAIALRPTWKENLYTLLVVLVVLGAILS